ncbi:hypothetical protein BIV57_04335 [Mangrovactinospora gilvigrisea]|uniref:Nitroreductase family deazaflavin-dependent oxidoreductase n=1 Tax=Mangrovactinospora gilvigrisea TaxID=1428644 RepID=A0A1J7BJA4_9ACTN|nr:nitroreductase/quinone reductase family protein [Mangrovactinospora gilvigrisea]OIV38718.1 hypothetical protein BIV57_04335 [Mangrovactinospora gilvigrisea]
MNDEIRAALAIAADAAPGDRTIDITTYGAASGQMRRIEIWFHHVDGRWFLSGRPGRRDWYANLRKDPRLIVHLKHGVRADLPATGVPITDPDAKRPIINLILRGLQAMNGWATGSADEIEAWIAGSPLVEIRFDRSTDPWPQADPAD